MSRAPTTPVSRGRECISQRPGMRNAPWPSTVGASRGIEMGGPVGTIRPTPVRTDIPVCTAPLATPRRVAFGIACGAAGCLDGAVCTRENVAAARRAHRSRVWIREGMRLGIILRHDSAGAYFFSPPSAAAALVRSTSPAGAVPGARGMSATGCRLDGR